jgi:hypothetical protein
VAPKDGCQRRGTAFSPGEARRATGEAGVTTGAPPLPPVIWTLLKVEVFSVPLVVEQTTRPT